MDRVYRNGPEAKFVALAAAKGWAVTKRGWPDFLVRINKNSYAVVEIKPRTTKGTLKLLKKQQLECLLFFRSKGIPCYVSDGEVIEEFNPAIHGDETRRRRKKT